MIPRCPYPDVREGNQACEAPGTHDLPIWQLQAGWQAGTDEKVKHP